MELKDFIKGIITDISLAIVDLDQELASKGVIINPRNRDGAGSYASLQTGRAIKEVEFNLSVSASDITEKGGGIKINVLSAGVSTEANHTTVSTVKFSIPVAFPGAEGPLRDYK